MTELQAIEIIELLREISGTLSVLVVLSTAIAVLTFLKG